MSAQLRGLLCHVPFLDDDSAADLLALLRAARFHTPVGSFLSPHAGCEARVPYAHARERHLAQPTALLSSERAHTSTCSSAEKENRTRTFDRRAGVGRACRRSVRREPSLKTEPGGPAASPPACRDGRRPEQDRRAADGRPHAARRVQGEEGHPHERGVRQRRGRGVRGGRGAPTQLHVRRHPGTQSVGRA